MGGVHYVLAGVVQEQPHHIFTLCEDDDGGHKTVGKGTQTHFFDPFPDTVKFTGTIVLGGEDRHGKPRTDQGLGGQLLHPDAGSEAGNGFRTEGIGDCLHEEYAKTQDGKMYSHRHAHAEMFPQFCRVQGEILGTQTQIFVIDVDIGDAETGTDALGDDQGVGGAGHPPAQRTDEGDCKKDVHQSGKNQGVKRCFAVPQGPHNGRQKIVGHHSPKPVDDNHYVRFGHAHQVGRDIGPYHQWVYNNVVENNNDGNADNAEGDAAGNTAVHSVHILGTKTLAGDDAEAAGESKSNKNRKQKKRGGGPYGRQGFHS